MSINKRTRSINASVRSVALKLQRGERTMSAEHYESATVYFSDVSDFAELSASHNPMQIVVILNEIYKYVTATPAPPPQSSSLAFTTSSV